MGKWEWETCELLLMYNCKATVSKTQKACSRRASADKKTYYYQQMCKPHASKASQLAAKKVRSVFPRPLVFFKDAGWRIVETVLDGDCALDALGMAMNVTNRLVDNEAFTSRGLRKLFVEVVARHERLREREWLVGGGGNGGDEEDSEATDTSGEVEDSEATDTDTNGEVEDSEATVTDTSGEEESDAAESEEEMNEVSDAPFVDGRMDQKYFLSNDDVDILCAHFGIFPVIINQKYKPGSANMYEVQMVLFTWPYVIEMMQKNPEGGEVRVVVLYNRQDMAHYELLVRMRSGRAVALHTFADLPEQVKENMVHQISNTLLASSREETETFVKFKERYLQLA